MAGISTHVLDNYTGRPGVGMRIDFSARQSDGSWKFIKSMTTNGDGRTDAPVLAPADAVVGEYELAFHVADFYEPKRGSIGDPVFLDSVVPLRFSIFDAKQHFHVPLLCTPWSCSTYRGS
jgi:5-hydroxyisourate hydrolase